jgi:hypothetical protein
MDDISFVQIIYSFEDLPDRLGCIFFRESTLIAYSVKQFAAYCELRHNVVFILQPSAKCIAS